MTRTTLGVLLAGLLAAGCHSPSSDVADRGEVVTIPVCTWPAAADTFDASSSTGCGPRSMFQICDVPEGSVVDADGTITTPAGATVTCDNACSPLEYSLSCYGPLAGEIPSPAPSLGCRPVAIPTPSNALFHCCPCAQ